MGSVYTWAKAAWGYGRGTERLAVTDRTVNSHVAGIFTEPGLDESPDGPRRVLMVLRYLGAGW
jgi:hypothetical protein